MSVVTMKSLLESGVHFGHQTKRWNPKMEEYLYGSEGGVHIFDLTKTKPMIEEALEFLSKVSKEGKKILILGTKKQIKEKVAEMAPDVIQQLRERGDLPLVVEIPDRFGTKRGPDFLTRYVQEAIGVKM